MAGRNDVGFITKVCGAALLGLLAVAMCAGAQAEDEAQQELDVQQQRYLQAFAAGQEALLRDEYRAAVDAFRRACESGPDSAQVGDALYWQAFARYRSGSTTELKAAAESLERVFAAYRMSGSLRDAGELATRIRGELARRGDTASAALISARAMELEQQAAEVRELAARRQRVAEQHRAALLAYEDARRVQEVAEAEAPEAPELPLDALHPGLLGELLGAAGDPLRQAALACSRIFPAEKEDDIRMAALTALSSMDPDRTLPILQSVLGRRDADSARLREQALMVLSMHESPEAEQLILGAAREDPDATVRGKALLYLGMSSNPEALDLLEQTLLQPGSDQVQEDALSALQMNEHPRAVEILRKVAARSSAPVALRARAVLLLGERRSSEDLDLLQRLYAEASDPGLQEAIVMAVGFHQAERSRVWLLGLLSDPATPPSAREKALFCVGEDKDVPTRWLVELYPRLVDGETRRHAVLVIGQRQDAEALDFVIRVAREEKKPEARRAAIFLLGESRDPRALEVLRELIAR